MNPSGEKTEQATPRRLIKARKEGQFAASHDFVSGLQFTVFVMLIAQTGPSLLATLKEVTRGLFIEAFRGDLGPATLIGILHEALSRGLSPLVYASGILLAYRFRVSAQFHRLLLQPLAHGCPSLRISMFSRSCSPCRRRDWCRRFRP